MSIFIRIWITFASILCIGGYLFFANLEKQVKPTAQQVVEDTLIDTTHLLANIVKDTVLNHTHNLQKINIQEIETNINHKNSTPLPHQIQPTQITSPQTLKKQLDDAFIADISAKVWNNHKADLDFHLYITNQKGTVIYDSEQMAMGKDYSRWNDVYLTLQGKYGARATEKIAGDATSSVMYVAAPIKHQGDIIGVLTIGKPNRSLLPYLERTKENMIKTALWMGFISLVLSALVALWIRRSIYLVNAYTQSLAKDANKPFFFLASELNDLSNSIETMRDALENKAYVTQYVHTLTHELKSPITAIQASSELLAEELPEADRTQFSKNIYHQCQKLLGLVEHMLLLAKLEQPNFKLDKKPLNLADLIQELINQNVSKIQKQHIDLHIDIDNGISIIADRFWLCQAIQNILENAIHFCTGTDEDSAQLWIEAYVTHDINASASDGTLHQVHVNKSGLRKMVNPNNTTIKKIKKIQNASAHDIKKRISENPLEPVTFMTKAQISDNIVIKISNTGQHIPDYALPKLFERYFSLPKNQTSKGTGIGLTLVKEVIEKHGGHVSIANTFINNNQLDNSQLNNNQPDKSQQTAVCVTVLI